GYSPRVASSLVRLHYCPPAAPVLQSPDSATPAAGSHRVRRHALEILMKTWLTMCALVALPALVATPAAAQQPAAATIRGRVLDPQHRGVAAQITVTQTRTGLEHQTFADAAGYFALISLPPDAVDLTVTAAGFA